MISKAPGATSYVPPHLRRSKRTPGGVSLDAGSSTKDPQPEVIVKPSEELSPSASGRAPPHAPMNDLPHDPAIIQASGPITTPAQSSTQEATQTFPKYLNGADTGLATPAPSSPEAPKQDHSKPPSPKQDPQHVKRETPSKRLPTTDQRPETKERAAPHQQRKAARPPRETRNPRWPSNKETRAPKDGPKQWLSPSDDGGWSVYEDAGNDPDYDVKQLMDWTGKWMNAPGDWEGRGKYDDPNFKTRIVDWIEKHADVAQNPVDIGDDHHKDFTAIQNGEMANRDWVPVTIGEDVANVWWSKHLRTGAEWLEDLHDKPFWEKYISSTSYLLAPLAVPDAALDSSDAEYARALQDAGSDAKTMDAIKKAASQEKRRKLTEKQERQAKLESKKAAAAPPVFEPSQRPKVNIFLRLALPADGGQIAEIYNWHVENTINVPERTPRTRSMMLDRIASSVELKLPVLVAVEKAQRTKGNRGLPYVQEKIVGYAIADDYHDIDEMMRYTATAEVYVHHDYFRKGVGRCLLDRLMHLLDPVYHSRGGYEFLGDGGPETLAGGRRVIENVIAYVNHETANPERIKWIERWLKQWNFAKVGDLPGIGIKQGKRVSQAIFHVKTGSILNPANAL
ncbi:hypothetical protein H2201_002717 [Coniosporium apollinis]|uniref:N-acetyltransferase domain-containing protein n=1 Tax=Coniosporium apollinis TaxID=61459 RepID=A0ABQ9NZP5_9PEZI|nr:hypothetical protein H2201_002717 [Coniosporium apollinis]